MSGDIPPGMHWDDIRGWHQPDNKESVFLTSINTTFDGIMAEAEIRRRLNEWEERRWQPIETAPKDREVILYTRGDDATFFGRWDAKFECFFTDGGSPMGKSVDGWDSPWTEPTHWMPAPPKPAV